MLICCGLLYSLLCHNLRHKLKVCLLMQMC